MSPGDVARLEALVKGRVQGVGFRYFVMSEALRLGLTGWVANEQDGSVYCVAEGRREDLLLLLEALHEGPAAAMVDRVVEAWLPGTGAFADFGLRSAGHRGD